MHAADFDAAVGAAWRRPDASAATNRANEAAASSKRFRAEVAKGIGEADEPADRMGLERGRRGEQGEEAGCTGRAHAGRASREAATAARGIAMDNAQFDGIAQGNPVVAIKQGDRMQEQVAQLRNQPGLGRQGRVVATRELTTSRATFFVVCRVRPRARRS